MGVDSYVGMDDILCHSTSAPRVLNSSKLPRAVHIAAWVTVHEMVKSSGPESVSVEVAMREAKLGVLRQLYGVVVADVVGMLGRVVGAEDLEDAVEQAYVIKAYMEDLLEGEL